ncbi:unnamed protein product [Choristocarpus tenellus]
MGESDERGDNSKGRAKMNGKWGGGEVKKRTKPDPFRLAKAKADKRRQEVEKKQQEKEQQKKEKDQRQKTRRRQHSLLSKRTRGGQPIMRHTIQHLLGKLQAQKEQQQTGGGSSLLQETGVEVD